MVREKLWIVNACMLALLVGVLMFSGCAERLPAPPPVPAPPPKPVFKMPDPIVSASLDVGSSGYIIASAIGDAMRKERGITLRIVPIGTDTGRLGIVAGKRGHLTWLGGGVHLAQEAVYEFCVPEWGPQRVQMVAAGVPPSGTPVATAKDANITACADFKGKRVAYVPGWPTGNLIAEAYLAFAGLTWKDVKRVDFPSFGAAGRGVIEGKVDAAACASTSAWCYELEASPRGLHWPPVPRADEEGWKRLRTVIPILFPVVATVGAGLSEKKPVEMATHSTPTVVVYDWTDAELAYHLAKMVHELWPVYSKVAAPGIEQFDPERRIYKFPVPYHEGAIRYYKEIGKWTAEYDKHNDLLSKRQEVLAKAWEKALAEAAAQKVKAADSPKFWERIRVESLKAAGMDVYYTQ